MRSFIKASVLVFCLSFLLNLFWEFAQMPLYREGSLPFSVHAPMCFLATVWDAGYTTIVYFVFSAFLRDARWLVNFSWQRISSVVLIGLVTASVVEWRALRADKWAYAASMPIIPFLEVGLTPFFQLALLSLATFMILKKFSQTA